MRVATDAAGAVTDTWTYSVDGQLTARTGTTPVTVGWRGETHDTTTGLIWLRARWYDPATARFLSADPWHGNPANPISLNRYVYANADPVNMHDPTGRFALAEELTATEVIGVLAAVTAISILTIVAVDAANNLATALHNRRRIGQDGPTDPAPRQPGAGTQTDPVPVPVPEPQFTPEPNCDESSYTGYTGVAPRDLWAIGRAGLPPHPRDTDLLLTPDGYTCPRDVDGNYYGVSSFDSKGNLLANVSGRVWRLPGGTVMPGLDVFADGIPDGHHTIFTTSRMTPAEAEALYLQLPWEDEGRAK